jgi:hypothetical protein
MRLRRREGFKKRFEAEEISAVAEARICVFLRLFRPCLVKSPQRNSVVSPVLALAHSVKAITLERPPSSSARSLCALHTSAFRCRRQTHLPGFGSFNKLCTLVKIAMTSYVGLHLFCKISRHSSPLLYTFGWNIFDTNLTCGGRFG